MNAIDLLGTLMNSSMSRSSGRRIENSIGSGGIGAPGGILGQVLGGATGSGGLMDMLGKMAGSLSQGGSGGAGLAGTGTGSAGGGLLGSLAGALFGG
ncbi:MAG: hypothetical protein ACR2O5_02475, partial [Thiogranum sp.]